MEANGFAVKQADLRGKKKKLQSLHDNGEYKDLSTDESSTSIDSLTEELRKLLVPWPEELPDVKTAKLVTKKPHKEKSGTKIRSNIVYFKDGIHLNSSSSNVSIANPNTKIKHLEHKFVQCCLNKTDDELEVVLPSELQPLLINLTLLLHELKEEPDQSKTFEELYNLVSRITNVVAELSRRSIARLEVALETDNQRNLEGAANAMSALLRQHNSGAGKAYDNLLCELKRLENDILEKDIQVSALKDKWNKERSTSIDKSEDDVQNRLRSSIVENQKLKAEIKFNQHQLKKYKKILAEKEMVKNRSSNDLEYLRKKVSKLVENGDINLDDGLNICSTEQEVLCGGNLTKYIKTMDVNNKGKTQTSAPLSTRFFDSSKLNPQKKTP